MELAVMSELKNMELIPAPKLCEMIGVSRRTFVKWEGVPSICFPKPITIMGRKYYKMVEVSEWLERRAEHEEKLEFHGRGKGRPRLLPPLGTVTR